MSLDLSLCESGPELEPKPEPKERTMAVLKLTEWILYSYDRASLHMNSLI